MRTSALSLPLCWALGCTPVGTVGALNAPPEPAAPTKQPTREPAPPPAPATQTAKADAPAPAKREFAFEKESEYQESLVFVLKMSAGMPRFSATAEVHCARGYVSGKMDYDGFNKWARIQNGKVGCMYAVDSINSVVGDHIEKSACEVETPPDLKGHDYKGKAFLDGTIKTQKFNRDERLSADWSELTVKVFELCYDSGWLWGFHQPDYAIHKITEDFVSDCRHVISMAANKSWITSAAKITFLDKCQKQAEEATPNLREQFLGYMKARQKEKR